jgi:hypothetical protein
MNGVFRKIQSPYVITNDQIFKHCDEKNPTLHNYGQQFVSLVTQKQLIFAAN